MISLVIIDDEARSRSLLKSLVEDNLDWVTVVGEADSVMSGLQLIAKKQPEIILLDVEMQDGTGFDLLDRLDGDFGQVIFVTAYDNYAVKALRINAIDYIEKPVDPVELVTAMMKSRKLLESKKKGQFPEAMVSRAPDRIALPTKLGLKYIDTREITHVTADGSYSEIFLIGQDKPLVISRKLKEVQQTLEPMGFIRPNHSSLVNTNHVAELKKTDGGSLVLANGQIILLSKRYKELALKGLAAKTRTLG